MMGVSNNLFAPNNKKINKTKKKKNENFNYCYSFLLHRKYRVQTKIKKKYKF